MEELELTDPIIVPATSTNKYRVIAISLNVELLVLPATIPGAVFIQCRDNNGESSSHTYDGQTAVDMIKFLNRADFTTKSMHKRILERLAADGKLKPGTVVGAPDP